MRLRLLEGIETVEAAAWDALVPADDPFVRHAFLSLLERSGSAAPRTGWQPLHALLEDASGRALAAAPLYAKSHSWGEYVFDHGWAEAYERAGGSYYPKLQLAVPFTPVPGPRLLARGAPAPVVDGLVEGLLEIARKTRVSSLHVTFCGRDEAALLASHGFLERRGVQYHWHNRGYRDFQDFLDALRSSKKKMIRKEREAVRGSGIEVQALSGDAVTPGLLAGFHEFYLATIDKRWGNAYLTAAFFEGLWAMREHLVYVVARERGRVVAGALNLLSGGTLYGRLWGSTEEHRFLHFECCYYAAIELAIARNLARVEAGAQGQHKLQRGYEPVLTHSTHWIADPGLGRAVARFLSQERRHMELQLAELRALLPYRREEPA
ncbi:GNAT family N-acetyltransferase [Marinimicrococcus flavescens]|uniref:GNAT family N-acetyltransferase n=1 Tax=Marinimicrococcus flavescens TaxID=3031815 RepID=A0AAP3XRV5_9PROT|nr:GNAT family N-acetyltransferase [Marinimicrococcus flavescens]